MAGGHPHRGAVGMGVSEPKHGEDGSTRLIGVSVGEQSLNGAKRASAWGAGSEQDARAQSG